MRPKLQPENAPASLVLMAVFLAVVTAFGTHAFRQQGLRDIGRNTEHTISMLEALLQDDLRNDEVRLSLFFGGLTGRVTGGKTGLRAEAELIDRARAYAYARADSANITEFRLLNADGIAVATLHRAPNPGSPYLSGKAFLRARTSGAPEYSLSPNAYGQLMLYGVFPWPNDHGRARYVEIGTPVGQVLERVTKLLVLETEQHADPGEHGEVGIALIVAEDDRPLVNRTQTYPESVLPKVLELISSGQRTAESEGFQFVVTPLPDRDGKPIGHTSLVIDVRTAIEANDRKTSYAFAGLLVASLLTLFAARAALSRSHRRDAERQAALEEAVEARTAQLRMAEQQLREQNESLETQVAERTQRLHQALVVAESATQAKSEFLANMSHEIRTPMSAIIGLTNLCLQDHLEAKARDHIGRVHSAAHFLLGILNDILDISKVEAGKMVLEAVEFDLDDLIDRIVDTYSASAASKGLRFQVDVGTDVPGKVTGDPLRLSQVLNNLINNALKFTDHGSVTLEASLQAEEESALIVRFAVIDTGVGISESDIGTLFHAFSQADASSTRKYGGTGLGLAICSRLVDLMSGHIDVVSVPGRGSTFEFTVHLSRPSGPAASAPMFEDLSVEIDAAADDRRSVESAARRLGLAVVPEKGARLAGNSPTIRIVSLEGDAKHGAMTERANALPPDAGPIIAVIAPSGRLDAFPSNVTVVEAPLTRSRLRQAIASALGNAPSASPPRTTCAATRPSLAGFRILLVEDNEMNQIVASELIAPTGAYVQVANNGAEALVALSSGRWDLVLMDMQMPVMDGLSATQAIRSQPRFADLPVIAMTAHALAEQHMRAIGAGMNDFLTKPIDPGAFYTTLSYWLGAELQSSSNRKATTPDVSPGVPDTGLLLDPDSPHCCARRDPSLFARLLEKFIKGHENSVASIQTALESGDPAAVRSIAHRLKGSADFIGATRLCALARQTEAAIISGEAWQAAAKGLAGLIEQTVDEARQWRQAEKPTTP